jgi:hypothetical protein
MTAAVSAKPNILLVMWSFFGFTCNRVPVVTAISYKYTGKQGSRKSLKGWTINGWHVWPSGHSDMT